MCAVCVSMWDAGTRNYNLPHGGGCSTCRCASEDMYSMIMRLVCRGMKGERDKGGGHECVLVFVCVLG